TVAEWACRTADWLDPTRVPRPCRGVAGKAPPSSVGELRDLLQPGAHAPCARRGCSTPSTCADSRADRISHFARRSPSALHSDGIIGRHRWKGFDRPLSPGALIEVVLRPYEGTVRIARRDQAETDDLGRQV